MTATSQKLLDVLLQLLKDRHATQFEYIWEWEVSLLPERFLTVNGQDIYEHIGFDFSELELDQLVAAGYFDKKTLCNADTEVVIRYRLRT